MSDRARPRRNRAPLVVGALISAVALAGCSAGQITQTSRQVAAVEGANASAGDIAIRNSMIEYEEPAHGAAVHPTGSEAPVGMTIVNSGAELDRLVAASSPVASSVQISGVLRIPGGQALVVKGAPAAVAAPPAAPGATAGAQPSGAAEDPEAEPTGAPATGQPTAPPATSAPATATPGVPQDEAPAPGGAQAQPQDEATAGHIVLTGLREDVKAGLTYPLVLTFERAGDVHVEVPVANPDTLREEAAH